MKDDAIPVVRKTEVKYQKPENGILYSKATFSSVNKDDIYKNLMEKGRAFVPIKVEVCNTENNKTLSAVFDWLWQKSN